MKLELPNELITEINSLLSEIYEKGISSSVAVSELKKKSFRVSKALELIKLTSQKYTYELSEKGIFAIQDGGVEKYLESIRIEKDLDNQIRRLTKKRLEWEYGVNFLFLIIGSLITFFVTKFSESDNQKQNIEKIDNLKIEMYDSISKNRIRLNEQNTLILDIKNETDSLKIEN